MAGLSACAQAGTQVYFGGPDNSKLDLATPGSVVTPVRNAFLASLNSYGVEHLEDKSGINPTLTFPGTGISATTGFANGVNSAFQYSVSPTIFCGTPTAWLIGCNFPSQ